MTEIGNVQDAKQIIAENLFMVLATCADGEPWAAPLFFAVDENYSFYFVSPKDARHSVHINSNPNVAITVFDSHKTPEEADGVYVEATAAPVDRDGLLRAMEIVYLKRFPDEAERKQHLHPPEDFLGSSPRRFYCATPSRLYKLDRNNTTGVDRRIEINLAMFRKTD